LVPTIVGLAIAATTACLVAYATDFAAIASEDDQNESSIRSVTAASFVSSEVPAAAPGDRGGMMTISGDPAAPKELTPHHRAKLDRARAAIEESRLAGTLTPSVPPEGARTGVDRKSINAMKLARLRSQLPVPSDPSIDVPTGEERR
jgi:hypothetical protein